jgi:hypothetical protein
MRHTVKMGCCRNKILCIRSKSGILTDNALYCNSSKRITISRSHEITNPPPLLSLHTVPSKIRSEINSTFRLSSQLDLASASGLQSLRLYLIGRSAEHCRRYRFARSTRCRPHYALAVNHSSRRDHRMKHRNLVRAPGRERQIRSAGVQNAL